MMHYVFEATNRSLAGLFADRNGTRRIIVRLLREEGLTRWRRYALVIVWMAIGAGCTAASAYLIGHAINEVYVSRSFIGIVTVAIAIIVAFIFKGISSYGQTVELAKIANQMSAANQRRMFDKLLKQNLLYFSDKHSSAITSQIAYGSGSAANVLRLLITTLGRDLLTLIGLGSVMIVQTPLLALIGIVAMAPAVLLVRNLIKRVRAITRNEFAGSLRIAQSLQESIQGLRTVKALNLEDEMRRRLEEDTRSVEQASNKLARVMNRSSPLMESLAGVAVGLILIYGGYEMLIRNAAPGQFSSFIAAFLLAYEPGKRIARLNVDVTNSIQGVQMLFDIFDLPEPRRENDAALLHVDAGVIVFDSVFFQYKPGHPVLRDLSFVAKPDQTIALVGPSGSGKTTIFNLVLSLYEPQAGEVQIDGQSLARVSGSSVRDHISYVGQDIFLFHGSIKSNIRFGRLGATDADVIAAAKAAHAHDFIMLLPAGYDTPVGEHGLQLSGGQRQRIAVARALIRNAAILLLDEPTASLDSESEFHVQAAIQALSAGRTTLVIAHRLNTVRHADIIHVIEGGQIVESGTHQQLLSNGGRYADIYHRQFENQINKRYEAEPEEAPLS